MGLDLNLSTHYLAKPLSQFLDDVSKIKDNHSKLSEMDGYVGKLVEERKKIEVFKRELPLSMFLLTEAIETLREKASSVMASNGEFDAGEGAKMESDNKKNWMSSAQLWISNSNSTNVTETCNNSNRGGAFPSFNSPPPPAPLSLMTPTSEILTDYSRIEQNHHQFNKHLQIRKKEQRRRWTEDLHRMFIDALEMIGGSQVATPKQIRDMMKVDGLTNDEVKSHLQKYRMYIRNNHPLQVSDRETQRLISLSRSDSPQGPLVDRGLFSNNGGHSSEDEQEKSDGRSWKSESRMKRLGLDLVL